MKKLISTLTLSATLLCTSLYAQTLKVPAASSASSIKQSIGIHEVELKYNRPDMNGRKIFGKLVPYGEVWRLGANTIPTIKFEETVMLEGNKVDSGTYGMLAIPNKDSWTIILSKKSNQWGAYSYKQEDDYLRFNVKPQTLKAPVETYTMSFDNVTPSSATLSLAWEQTQVQLNIKVDQKAEILASIDEAMKGEKKPYIQAAQYYYFNNLDQKKALEWINAADAANPNQFYIKYWKAKILLKSGDKTGAAAAAKEGVALSEKENLKEYINLNNDVLKEATK